MWGSWGGRANHDGVDGLSWLSGNQANQPIELIESNNPVEVRRYGYVADSGGPGKNRGGMALMVEWGLFAEEAVFTSRSDRRFHLPYGLDGGKAGTPSWIILNSGRSDQKVLPVLQTEALEMRKGESVLYIKEGSGGYGDPLERDPKLVAEEVLDEKFSVEYVKTEYGVVIDPISRTLDRKATADLRQRMATTQGERPGAESHVEHFVKSLGLDPQIRHRAKASRDS